jgi:SEC-C motif-containing protein
MEQHCYCGSQNSFAQCCQAIIDGVAPASDAQSLMRSRYSAYCVANYDYLLRTYAKAQQQNLTVDDLQQSAQNTQWLALLIEQAGQINTLPSVTFKAFYKVDNQLHVLHETSYFAQEAGHWVYTHGDILEDSGPLKIDRNEVCFCQSGKKYKRCCYMK